jgi:hypothetical protein
VVRRPGNPIARLGAVFAALGLAMSLSAGAATASPLVAWGEPIQLDNGSTSRFDNGAGIDCASASFCVAVGGDGRILTTTDPTGGQGAWEEAQVETAADDDLTAVSCASEGFCAAADQGGRLLTSTDPTGGAGAWSAATIDEGKKIVGLSCPSVDFCAALGQDGRLFLSDEPGMGAAAWVEKTPLTPESREPPEPAGLTRVSCASASLCVVAYGHGWQTRGLLVSTDPLSGVAWEDPGVDLGEGFSASGVFGISCPSDGFCGVVFSGGILVSGEPAGGVGAWHLTHSAEEDRRPSQTRLEYNGGSISCPSASFCLSRLVFPATESFATGTPRTFVSTQPATVGSWSVQEFGLTPAFDCTSSAFCAAVYLEGDVTTSTEPSGGANTWHAVETGVVAPSIGWVSCPTSTLCAATGTLGRLYTSTDPTDPASWTVTRLAESVGRVYCASAEWCTVAAAGPSLMFSTDPAGGALAWSSVSRPAGRRALCPSAGFCAELAGDDEVLTSSEPLSGAGSWTATDFELGKGRFGPFAFGQLTCPTAGLCVIAGDWASVYVSTEPGAGKQAWKSAYVGVDPDGHGDQVVGVSCPTAVFCAATSARGSVATTSDPSGGPASWQRSTATHYPGSISCAADASICVAIDYPGNVLTSRLPTVQTGEWGTREAIDENGSLNSVSCALDGSLCAVADGGGIFVGVPEPFTPPSVEPEKRLSPGPPAPPETPHPAPQHRRACARVHHRHHSGHAGPVGSKRALSSPGKRSKNRCVRPH